jgi:predicted DNA-binding transcriptional regulator AlpA
MATYTETPPASLPATLPGFDTCPTLNADEVRAVSAPLSRKLQDTLAYTPYALDADRAAAYICMSKSKFLELVDAREAPQPLDVGGCPRWLRRDLEAWLDGLSTYAKRPAPRKTTLADLLTTAPARA